MNIRTQARKSRKLTVILIAITMAVALSWLALKPQTAAMQETAKDMPALTGEAAVKYLKKETAYGSLGEAIAAIDNLPNEPEAVTKLTADDGAANHRFGHSVAIAGDTAIVGAFLSGNGAAYVFVRSGTTWNLQQKLTANDGVSGDNFGVAVAISGDTVVVGANNGDGTVTNQGSAYVFIRTGTAWAQEQELTASDGATGNQFGNTVAISGDTVIVGAFRNVGSANNTDQGAAYIFVRNGAIWNEQQKLLASDGQAWEEFGRSVTISGDTVIVGTPGDDFGPGVPSPIPDQGSAYVFVRSGTSWTEQQKLIASDGEQNDRFGVSLAFSGETLLIGAQGDDLTAVNSNEGSAYIFTRNGTNWAQLQKLVANDAATQNFFGNSVSISGDKAIIGASNASIGAIAFQGAAYFFDRNDTTWTQRQKVTAADGAASDFFGFSAAISDDIVIIGVPFDDIGANSNQGSAYLVPTCELTQQGCETEIEVNITTDEPDADLEDDVCDVDLIQSENQCSLRAAIQTANAKVGPDEILFNIPGGGPHTISPLGLLPGITEKVTIDATTQPGYSGTPLIELRGGGESYGLGLEPGSNDSLISGFAINRFGAAIAIQSGGNRVERSYLGLGADGLAAGGTEVQSVGVDMRTAAAANNIVGGAGASGNVISDNAVGVAISQGAPGNMILGNKIGTNTAGTSSIHNLVGVYIDASSNNKIGDAVSESGNLISGNTGVGIQLATNSSSNLIVFNKIGTNAAGTEAIANPIGVNIEGSNNNVIGSDTSEFGNLISGNSSSGVAVRMASSGNVIKGNRIGTNADGTAAIANDFGVVVDGSNGNTIGGITNVTAGNLLSGNTIFGVLLQNDASANRVVNNSIGTTASGMEILPNGDIGVLLTAEAHDNFIEKNVIGGHTLTMGSAGISFAVTAGPNNSVTENHIGVVRNSTAAISNQYGIVSVADGQIIGAQNAGNIIGHNVKAGIWITSLTGSTNPVVENNLIQYNFVGNTGSQSIGNTEIGIWVNGEAQTNTVTKNIASGNGGFGIVVADGARTNTVKENLVGTNTSGTSAIPNGGGIWIRQAIDTTVESNLVSGNSIGMLIGTNIGFGSSRPFIDNYQPLDQKKGEGSTYTSGNKIFGNIVGLNAAKNAPLPGSIGIAVGENARDNQIGTATGGSNLISGNTATVGYGIFLGTLVENPAEEILPQSNLFQKNIIGLAGDLQATIANNVGFVLLQAVNNTIGGSSPDLGNVVVGSTFDGLQITDGARMNTIQNNRIGVLPGTSLRSTVAARTLAGSGAGNGGEGIKVAGTNATGNQLIDNFVANNRLNGILIASGASGTNIVGTQPEQSRSLIADNGENGIKIEGVSDVNVLGTIVTRCAEAGLFVDLAQRVKIGDEDAGNQIADNGGDGIRAQHVDDIRVIANKLGMIQDELLILVGNEKNGINLIGATNAQIGEANDRRNNIIILSKRYGMLLDEVTELMKVQNNLVGTTIRNIQNSPQGRNSEPSGQNLGNLLGGVRISNGSRQNIIGGSQSGTGNVIANNGGPGVWIDETAGTGNLVDPNSIYGNAGPGIALGDAGHTPNDPADADTGPNNLQNYPTFTLSIVGGDLIVDYQVDSAPENSAYGSGGIYVEFFEADALGAGRDFLGSDHYLLSDYNNGTPGTRQKNLGNAAALGFAAEDRLTATATDAEDNSSEFSPAVGGPAAVFFEGDVAMRPNGDGTVTSGDVTQLRRFVTGLDLPSAGSNEATRADCAPRTTLGDGSITSGDVVQGRRYATGLDPPTPTGGPMRPAIRFESIESVFTGPRPYALEGREIRVGSVEGLTGKIVRIPVEMVSLGNEAAMSFTLEYDGKRLSNPRVDLGDGAPVGAFLTVNTKEKRRIGVLIDSTEAMTASAMPKQIVMVTFEVRNRAGGPTPIKLTGALAPKGFSDAAGNSLASRYLDGNVILPGK